MNAAAIISKHLLVPESAILRIEEWTNCLFVVAREIGARFVSKKVIKKKAYVLEISNMLAAGKKGWVRGEKEYIKAVSQSSYGASRQVLRFELSDGIYQIQDANYGSSRTRNYWLKVQEGEAVEIEPPKPNVGIELPELEGSPKQIAWAEQIRVKAMPSILSEISHLPAASHELAKILIAEGLGSCCKAAWWIDYEGSAALRFVEILKQEMKVLVKEYPTKKWQDYPEEAAHEGEGGEWVWLLQGKEVFPGVEKLAYNFICKNPESQEWEIWHYYPSF